MGVQEHAIALLRSSSGVQWADAADTAQFNFDSSPAELVEQQSPPVISWSPNVVLVHGGAILSLLDLLPGIVCEDCRV